MDSRHVRCGYCDRPAVLVGAEKIYPHRRDLLGRSFWECEPCNAYVGCHPGGTQPLGRLANAALRKAKQRVHEKLDPLWKSGGMKRSAAYAMLASGLGIAKQNCHIGMFDLATCEAALQVLVTSTRQQETK